LPDDQRLVTTADLLYDSDPKDAGTGTWFDKITPNLLSSGGGDMHVVAQFNSVIPNGYTKDGRGTEEFKSAIAQIIGSVGRDVSALPPIAQAAAAAQWFKRSCPPHDMALYIHNKYLEIERRAGKDEQTRFAPIFVIAWREYCPPLAELWPYSVNDILRDTAGLMISLGVADGHITPQSLNALTIAMKDYAAFATADTNEERTAQIIHAHKHAKPTTRRTPRTTRQCCRPTSHIRPLKRRSRSTARTTTSASARPPWALMGPGASCSSTG